MVLILKKDPKVLIALAAKSCKRLSLALGQADKKNSHAPSCVFVCPMNHFTIQKSENNVQVMKIRSDCYLCSISILRFEFLSSDFSENVLHT